ncbi:hypothetical protein MAE02_59400 [Microvirga aerophila]|uniref:Uncharacterized protein n=1 Tax=Microvirga aerophila TaxID=670291 RepID=A0A512C1Z6_9HYPH|nr:hypothetical protein MAE02_59400 [Microvirga aerophila]
MPKVGQADAIRADIPQTRKPCVELGLTRVRAVGAEALQEAESVAMLFIGDSQRVVEGGGLYLRR